MASSTLVQKVRRQKKIFSWTGVMLVVVIVALLNFIVSYLTLRVDFSQGRLYSLSSGSKQLLKKIDDQMLIRIIFTRDLPPPQSLYLKYLQDILAEYRRASGGKIRVEYLDPGISPQTREEALAAGVTQVQVDISERDRREVKEAFMGVAFYYGEKRDAIKYVDDTRMLEYEITSAIKRLTSSKKPVVGVVTAGGALTFASDPYKPVGTLAGESFEIKEVNLASGPVDGIDTLWLMGPTEPVDAATVAALRAWVNKGGTLGLLLDRYTLKIEEFRATPMNTGLEDLLKEWGIDFKQGLIYDPQCEQISLRATQGAMQMVNVLHYPYFPKVTDISRDNPATKAIPNVSFAFSSPLIIEKNIPGLRVTSLARTTRYSWLNTQPFAIDPYRQQQPGPDSINGPFNVGVVIEGKFDDGLSDGKVIVVGSSKIIRADYPLNQSNVNFFMNLLDWSAQDEVMLSIRAKSSPGKPLRRLPDGVVMIFKWLMIALLPVVSVAAGIVVWKRGQRRRARLAAQYKAG